MSKETAYIVGVGSGLSASLARLFAREGIAVALAARNVDKLADLAKETKARAYRCDATVESEITRFFEQAASELGEPDVVVFNGAGGRYRGPFEALESDQVRDSLLAGGYSGFLVAQQAARRMLERGRGTILFTGATASVKAFAQSAPFAMNKFALRALAQSLARELAPKNIHVAHVVIDGGIASSWAKPEDAAQDRWLEPDAIAQTYLHLHRQQRSAWTWEVEVRPWTEKF
jgi:NAD(P)-dependent dehydrogenase (short-subunit alcohol dehydrogenase family)